MEETGTTIHSALSRRNNFLRENPQSVSFRHNRPARRRAGRMKPQDPGRAAAAGRLQ